MQKTAATTNKHLAISMLALTALGFIVACSSIGKPRQFHPRPTDLSNACNILNNDSSWYQAFDKTFKKYGVPPHVIMAIIYKESTYRHDALSKSMAYGYAQAKDATWKWYQNKTGHHRAKRDVFTDAVDFIGWYLVENQKRTGISKWDAREQYLAYHEGTGGYLKATYNEKPWLLEISDQVDLLAKTYRRQLASCYTYPQLDL
ncbi:MAG: lytic transglycosylase [Gammaproteobacteria bacterium]|nr:MAG: lytic transglycosylase [Gammaproteobacteria bacterium]